MKLRIPSVLSLPDVQLCHHNHSLPSWRQCTTFTSPWWLSPFTWLKIWVHVTEYIQQHLAILFSKVRILTSRRLLLHKVPVVHLANKLPAFYIIWLWITRDTNSPKKKLSWTSTADSIAKMFCNQPTIFCRVVYSLLVSLLVSLMNLPYP
jgi:hypothetical protein